MKNLHKARECTYWDPHLNKGQGGEFHQSITDGALLNNYDGVKYEDTWAAIARTLTGFESQRVEDLTRKMIEYTLKKIEACGIK